MSIMDVISEIYQLEKYIDSAVFSEDELNYYEKKIWCDFSRGLQKTIDVG
jgi:hypothetical protein